MLVVGSRGTGTISCSDRHWYTDGTDVLVIDLDLSGALITGMNNEEVPLQTANRRV